MFTKHFFARQKGKEEQRKGTQSPSAPSTPLSGSELGEEEEWEEVEREKSEGELEGWEDEEGIEEEFGFSALSKADIPAFVRMLQEPGKGGGQGEEPLAKGLTEEQLEKLFLIAGIDVKKQGATITPEEEELLLKELALKRRAFQVVFEDEYTLFLEDATVVHQRGTLVGSVFLLLLNCPLFKSPKLDSTKKVEELILALPTLVQKTSQTTQKKMAFSIRDIVLSIYLATSKNELEARYSIHKNLRYLSTLTNTPTPSAENLTTPSEDKASHSANKKQLFGLLALSSAEAEKHGGIDHFFRIICEHETIHDLPELQQKLMEASRRVLLPYLTKITENPSQMASIEAIYAKLPKKILKGIFKISNPIKVMTKLTSLLSKDVLGNKTLLQHMILSVLDLEKTQKRVITLSKGITKEQQKAIDQFFLDDRAIHMEVDNVEDFIKGNRDLVLVLERGGVSCEGISTEELGRCRAYFEAQATVLEKKNLSEVVKSAQMRDLIKTLYPMVNDLLAEIYVVKDLPQLISDGLALMKEMIDISHGKFPGDQTKDQAYFCFSVQIIAMGYQLARCIAMKRDGPIYQLAKWGMDLWNQTTEGGIRVALEKLGEEEKGELLREAETLRTYYDLGGNGMGFSTPSASLILLVEVLKQQLKSREPSP